MNGPRRLSLTNLQGFRHQGSGRRSGRYLRFYCPIHRSDHQRSLSLDPETGYFRCFGCGAWGYVEEIRAERQDGNTRTRSRETRTSPRNLAGMRERRKEATMGLSGTSDGPQPRPDLEELLHNFQAALPGSLGEKYLKSRGIPLELAQACGAGYAPPGSWPHKGRDWNWGRVVFPHTNPEGRVVNLYGRAVEGVMGSDSHVPKETRHDHLPGPKGIFNAKALASDTVFVCEGVFDALSLMAAGHKDACAIFGVDGLRWEWVKAERLVFCFDQDLAGERWRELAWEGTLRGKEIYFLLKEVFGGYKDLNEAWVALGKLEIGPWPEPFPCIQDTSSGNKEPTPNTRKLRLETERPQAGGAGDVMEGARTTVFARGLSATEVKSNAALEPCHCCGGTRFWRSVYGLVICGTCHPPATPELVQEWVDFTRG